MRLVLSSQEQTELLKTKDPGIYTQCITHNAVSFRRYAQRTI